MNIDLSKEPYLLNEESIQNNSDESLYIQLARHYKGFDRGHSEPILFEIKEEITFFAGSFNPWHDGHKECVLKHGIDNLIIAPDFNPQKNTTERNIQQTLNSIYNSLKDHGLKYSQIYPGFLAKGESNPTIIWIRQLFKANSKLKLNLLIGYDSFMQIDSWICGDEILKSLNKLYIVSRLDNPTDKLAQSEKLKLIAPHLKLVFLGSHDHEDKSSTLLRG